MPLVESDYLPFSPGELPRGPWLILAPHPDDETFGMGGSIRRGTLAGLRISVIVLTDGALGGNGDENLVTTREREARTAAKILGIDSIDFWREPDRTLAPRTDLIQRVATRLVGEQIGSIFFPSLTEPHPDHRAAALIGWEACRRTAFLAEPLAYEISSQGPINLLLDITHQITEKCAAMKVYSSQEAERPYTRRVLSQNIARTWSLSESVQFAESFLRLELKDQPLHELAAQRFELYLLGLSANGPGDLELLSASARQKYETDAAFEALRHEIHSLKESRSWRLTAPYRRVGRLFHRLLARCFPASERANYHD